jgi:putative SOS response-associated peptidase YedK
MDTVEVVRKIKEGETENDVFGFLTTEPNALVAQYHPKTMPVILTTQDEIDTWVEAPTPVALQLQRPLPDDALVVVTRGQSRTARKWSSERPHRHDQR